MRNTIERKAETRQRILEAASALFRQHGVDAVGVDAIMRAAGLTHGGFYGHFASKEALVGEVVATSLARAASRWERTVAEAGEGALNRIVAAYLDPAHVAEVERGCMLTTIGPEVSRRPGQRPAASGSVRRMAAALEQAISACKGSPSGRDRALTALSTMVGAVVLARLADDPAEAEAVLDSARRSILGGS
jgi:TetR/AcrR family transcriptional repressor of nem operon